MEDKKIKPINNLIGSESIRTQEKIESGLL